MLLLFIRYSTQRSYQLAWKEGEGASKGESEDERDGVGDGKREGVEEGQEYKGKSEEVVRKLLHRQVKQYFRDI